MMSRQKNRDPLVEQISHKLTLNINPRSIRYFGKLRPLQRKFNILRKIGLPGLYDLIKPRFSLIINHKIEYRLFTDSRKYQFMKELWGYDFDYQRTEWYQTLKQKIDKGKSIDMPVKGYHINSRQQLNAYCLDYVALLQSMARDGFILEKGKDEIGVIIDPKGDLLKSSKGRHRLAAAQIVGVKSIPVRVRHIHKKWIDRQSPAGGQDVVLKDRIIQALDKVRLTTR